MCAPLACSTSAAAPPLTLLTMFMVTGVPGGMEMTGAGGGWPDAAELPGAGAGGAGAAGGTCSGSSSGDGGDAA